MGQFSWYTQDTEEQIFNDWDMYPNDKQTIHMVDPRNGNDYKEEAYDGYGRFGGMDFYALIVDINKDFILKRYTDTGYLNEVNREILSKPLKEWSEKDQDKIRHIGIELWYKYFEPLSSGIPGDKLSEELAVEKRSEYNLLSPILIKDYNNWKRYANPYNYPESDPDQGWHIQNEEDEE